MDRTTVIVFGFTFGLLSAPAQSATYYLDSALGNDWHGGTEIVRPLKTLHSASFNLYHPGDQILLKAGSVWKGETLHIATSGESGEPITISSYGTGTQPVIDGANSSSPPITLQDSNNVTVSNLTIQNASRLIQIERGSNIIIRNCTLINASLYGIDMKQTTAFTVSNNTYTTTGNIQTIGGAIRISAPVTGVTVTGNNVTFNGASNGAIGIYVFDVNNAVVSGNTVTGGSQGIGIKGYTRSVTGAEVFNNAVYDSHYSGADGESIEFTGWKNTPYRVSGSIHHNFIQGGSMTLNAIAGYQATDSAVYNNIIIGPLLNAAIHWSTSSTGGLFYGNTVYNVPIAFGVYSGCSATIQNNIVSKAGYAIFLDKGTVVEDYDIFFESGTSGMTLGAHTNTSDPQFDNPSPAGPLDVELRSTSPAIHSGTSLSFTYKDALDPASASFPCSLLDQTIYGWNRGAFGFNGRSQVNPIRGPSSHSNDFDLDGKADLAVWRPSLGNWYVIPSSNPHSPISQQLGLSGDIPVPGDYDGDGKADFAVWRPSLGEWYVIPSSNPSSLISQQLGLPGDIPVPGDYDGDGKTDFAVWRPSLGEWYIVASSNPPSLISQQLGLPGDIPVPGDYDGDGTTDFAVWRPSSGEWYITLSANPSSPMYLQWGLALDLPL